MSRSSFHWYLVIIYNAGCLLGPYTETPKQSGVSSKLDGEQTDNGTSGLLRHSSVLWPTCIWVFLTANSPYIFTLDSLGRRHEDATSRLESYLRQEAHTKKATTGIKTTIEMVQMQVNTKYITAYIYTC